MSRCVIGKCLLLNILNKKRMSQADLAAITGISKTQISEYIGNARNMSLANAILIAHTLKVDVLDLYDYRIVQE